MATRQPAELATLSQLSGALNRVAENAPNGVVPWRALAAQYGISLPLGPGASDLNVVQALLDRLTPAQRQGLPGAASDRDVAMFRGSLPSLLKTADGNRQIMATLSALAESRVASGRIAARAMAGDDPGRVWNELQALPDPLAQIEQRRNAEDERVHGFSRTEIQRATKEELRSLARAVLQNPVAATLVRSAPNKLQNRERELLGSNADGLRARNPGTADRSQAPANNFEAEIGQILAPPAPQGID